MGPAEGGEAAAAPGGARVRPDLRRKLNDGHRLLTVAREMLSECRRALRDALAVPEPDPSVVRELAREEEVLLAREKEVVARMDALLAACGRDFGQRRVAGLRTSWVSGQRRSERS
jgi:hypothetical protein